MTPQQQTAIQIRDRLRNPPNAVPDTGINLRNGAPVLRLTREFRPSTWRTPKITLLYEIPPVVVEPIDIKLPPGFARPRQTCREIITEVCLAWGVGEPNLISDQRTRDVVIPRHVAFAIARRLTPLSLPAIGRFFSGRDHTTVLHGIKKMADHIAALNQELDDWSPVAEWVRAMKARLES